MSQYTNGNVSLKQNSATVWGASCDWLTASNVKIGDLFKKQGENAWYQVTSVNLATNINISPAYAAASVYNVGYLIVRDFTPVFSLPEITAGDYDWPDAYTRAIRTIDSNLTGGAANKWWNIAADQGTAASPNTTKDTLTFAGQGGIVASIDGDTVTIRNTGGSGAPTVQIVTASYHTQTGDDLIIASMTAGGCASIFLPDASTSRLLKFAVSTGSMVMIASGSDTIEGAATLGMYTQYNTSEMNSDGVSTWFIF